MERSRNAIVTEIGDSNDLDFKTFLESEGYLKGSSWASAFDSPIDMFRFYMAKLKTLVNEVDKVAQIVDESKITLKEIENCQEEILQRDCRIQEMQEELDNLTFQIQEERSGYFSIMTRRDMEKLEGESFRRKFYATLILGNMKEVDVEHFMKNNPNSSKMIDRIAEIQHEIAEYQEPSKKIPYEDPVIMKKKVDTLERHIALLEGYRKKDFSNYTEAMECVKKQHELERQESDLRAERLSASLREAKEYEVTLMADSVSTRQKMLKMESEIEETRLNLLTILREQDPAVSYYPATTNGIAGSTRAPVVDKSPGYTLLKQNLQRCKNQLLEKDNMLKQYELKFCRMEKEYQRFKEESAMIKLKSEANIRKQMERNKTLEDRFSKLEAARKFEAAGFRADIQGMKQLMTTMQRRLNTTLNKQSNERNSKPDLHLIPQAAGIFRDNAIKEIVSSDFSINGPQLHKGRKSNISDTEQLEAFSQILASASSNLMVLEGKVIQTG